MKETTCGGVSVVGRTLFHQSLEAIAILLGHLVGCIRVPRLGPGPPDLGTVQPPLKRLKDLSIAARLLELVAKDCCSSLMDFRLVSTGCLKGVSAFQHAIFTT